MVTKRQLAAKNKGLVVDNMGLAQRNNNLAFELSVANQRLDTVLAIVRHGAHNLASVFGSVTDLGHDEHDTHQLYSADNGLAMIAVNPATGEIVVTDPNNAVAGFSAHFDAYGDLDTDEQTAIRQFLAQVMFTRDSGCPAITGVVSLRARRVQDDSVAAAA